MMTFQSLDDLPLTLEQLNNLVRLPYRVGLWVSQSDNTGGEESDELEIQALETVLLTYGEDYCKSEFTHHVMDKTLAGYDLWNEWEEDIERVPDECRTLIYLLNDQIESKELDAFRESLFEIAETVALAYRELNADQSFLNKLKVSFLIISKRWEAFRRRYAFSMDHALNISPAEERALGQLQNVLRG